MPRAAAILRGAAAWAAEVCEGVMGASADRHLQIHPWPPAAGPEKRGSYCAVATQEAPDFPSRRCLTFETLLVKLSFPYFGDRPAL